MPIYRWKHEETGTEVEIIRSISEFESPPSEAEAPGIIGGTWIRLMGEGIGKRLTNAFGWGKGFHNSQTPGRGRQ